jgi:hypothetical protein
MRKVPPREVVVAPKRSAAAEPVPIPPPPSRTIRVAGVVYPRKVADGGVVKEKEEEDGEGAAVVPTPPLLSSSSVVYCAGLTDDSLLHDLTLAQRIDFPMVHFFSTDPAAEAAISRAQRILDGGKRKRRVRTVWDAVSRLRVPSSSLLHHRVELSASSSPAAPPSLTVHQAADRLGAYPTMLRIDLLREDQTCALLESVLGGGEGTGVGAGTLPVVVTVYWRGTTAAGLPRRQRILEHMFAIGYRCEDERAAVQAWVRATSM